VLIEGKLPEVSARIVVLASSVLVAVGCGSTTHKVVLANVDPTRLAWASELGPADQLAQPRRADRIRAAARASGATPLDVAFLSRVDGGQRRVYPVVTLETAAPAEYLKHGLRGFLRAIGYLAPNSGYGAFVEVVDERGKFVWAAGRFSNGGMVKIRPDLDSCSPIVHSQLVGANPPPCPAK
jgi:hypothetical protein